MWCRSQRCGADGVACLAGRPWTANELRLKSFDDLQALWFVLLKEKNAVLTERLHLKQGGVAQADASRLKKVRAAAWPPHRCRVPVP